MNTRHLRLPARVLAGAAALAALVSFTATLHADNFNYGRTSRSHDAADGDLVSVEVQVDGQSAPLYFRPGTFDRHYFQAFEGRNYSIVVHNNTGERVGVLLAVDGLNAVNGEQSSLRRGEPMYVLDPYETANIRGWRTSLDEVRRFVFVDEDRSYAERTGQANGDLGWIRVLSFREARPWYAPPRRFKPYSDERERRDGGFAPQGSAQKPQLEGAAPSAPEAKALRGDQGPTANASPGTGWGRRTQDPVSETDFSAARQATDRIALRYEYADGLNQLGIYPGYRDRLWEREHGQLGFAKPPRW